MEYVLNDQIEVTQVKHDKWALHRQNIKIGTVDHLALPCLETPWAAVACNDNGDTLGMGFTATFCDACQEIGRYHELFGMKIVYVVKKGDN